MSQDQIISALRAHEQELKRAGIASLSLIGSAARGDDPILILMSWCD
jgi:predicted nucleotidyltransferase